MNSNNKANLDKCNKDGKNIMLPGAITKANSKNKLENPQRLNFSDYKSEVNSINSIISREIKQMGNNVSLKNFILIRVKLRLQ